MKRFRTLILTIALVLVCAMAHAGTMQSSGSKAVDSLIHTGSGVFYGFCAATDGTNATTFSIYDNTAASGRLLFPTGVVTSSATDRIQCYIFENGIAFGTGIYVDITIGAGSVGYIIYFSQ